MTVAGAVAGLGFWVAVEAFSHWRDRDIDPTKYRSRFLWLRNHWVRWPVKACLALWAGIVGEVWVRGVALPAVRGGWGDVIALLPSVFISAGLGITIAAWTMRTDAVVIGRG